MKIIDELILQEKEFEKRLYEDLGKTINNLEKNNKLFSSLTIPGQESKK